MRIGQRPVGCRNGAGCERVSFAESPVESNPPSEPDLDAIELRPLHTEGDNIVDDLGREVLLRGANENALGEYWVGEPDLEPTVPTSDQDFADMRDLGFSGNRLVVSWSLIEPERGTFDEAYLDKIDAWVTKAAKHGMYTVIDMHQDAYTAFLQTPDGVTCPGRNVALARMGRGPEVGGHR